MLSVDSLLYIARSAMGIFEDLGRYIKKLFMTQFAKIINKLLIEVEQCLTVKHFRLTAKKI